ncbi:MULTISPECIES: biotin/lipoyl-containing protein [unclassified Dehalobacter]|jgi:Pyruvate/2-oxoglutarate dehydrogenase complex, dihydrolipoamide acyltransferase (E2) component, and related enzymes|uniref:biotin/lipoyl-containing protein n=1 Tax=unclassified Dehalobacter TaxID=2635733 RepID=UPI00028A572E|nr:MULTISPECIES: biotin/lipoyl-containing protein [unclassified Dehalobacter]AFV01195.1 hypothetical protein DHBDCA_p167 [Dehalobacter sp. DCA]AFV04237.1 hypothetical protein DCF50_p231 [Dehalobacter sp. CF]
MLEIKLNKNLCGIFKVGRVFVKEGDSVHCGEGLFTIEANKINTAIYANFEGEIISMNLAGGNVVKPDSIILTVDGQVVKESKTIIAN